MERQLSVIIVPGGGLQDDRSVTPWVQRRLDRATLRWKESARSTAASSASGQSVSCWPKILTLSAGTSHKPLPRDEHDFPVFESWASAQYLMKAGIPASSILMEWSSYDTIGNAYFARTQHTDICDLKNILVITSEFHLPRTKAVFEWVFSLPLRHNLPHDSSEYTLAFEGVSDSGTMADDVLASRCAREAQSVLSFQTGIMTSCLDLHSLHSFLFTKHAAYCAEKAFQRPEDSVPDAVLKSY